VTEEKSLPAVDGGATSSPNTEETPNTLETPLPAVEGGATELPTPNSEETTNTLENPLPTVEGGATELSENEYENLPEVLNENVNTLVELPVDYSTNLLYYYPYFYKTHLISIVGDVDLNTLVRTCDTPGCNYCTSMGICMRCDTGMILNGETCLYLCPDGYIADNLRMTCVLSTSKKILFKYFLLATAEVISSKAYSVGSCLNMCGSAVEDCR
jgi:hypothetical protein